MKNPKHSAIDILKTRISSLDTLIKAGRITPPQSDLDSLTRQVETLQRKYAGSPRSRRTYAQRPALTAAQLPENPNPEQLKAVFALTIESIYQDPEGVSEITKGPELKGRSIRGQFRSGRKVFDVVISNGVIDFQPAAGMTDKEFGG